MQTETHQSRYGRGRFLRQLGVTLTFALGAGGLASAARAQHAAGHCCEITPGTCPDPGGPQSCSGTDKLYHCNCTGISQDYCVCQREDWPQCYQGPC
jgi:hypothetical protein